MTVPCKNGHLSERNAKGRCKSCQVEAQQRYAKRHPERVREYQTRTRTKHAAYMREYREQHHERYLKNRRRQKVDHWAKQLLSGAKYNSKSRAHDAPTITEAWILSQPLCCPYLNVPLIPSVEPHNHWQPSLDRIDNSKGYTPDNVRLTSWAWNQMRGKLSLEAALMLLDVVRTGKIPLQAVA